MASNDLPQRKKESVSSDPWAAPAAQNDWPGTTPASNQNDAWGNDAPATSAHQAPTAADMFGGQSVRSFSFNGESPILLGGVITEIPPPMQKRDYYEPSKMLTWPDGKPMYTQPVVCQSLLAREDEDDDGTRSFFLDYNKMKAVKEALKKVGKTVPEVGGELWLEWYAMSGKSKLYRATYSPPGAAPQPFAAPAQQQAAPVDPWRGLNAAAVAELTAKGLTAAQVLPHITHLDGWQNAPAAAILGKIPRPAPVQDDQPPF